MTLSLEPSWCVGKNGGWEGKNKSLNEAKRQPAFHSPSGALWLVGVVVPLYHHANWTGLHLFLIQFGDM